MPEKEETASARQESGDLPMKVVTGEKDADARGGSRGAGNEIVRAAEASATGPAEAGQASSPGPPFPTYR